MIRGMYSAATALDAAYQRQEVTAHNLAHASTPGYRQRTPISETFDRVLGRIQEPTGDLTGTRVVGVFNDFRPGALQHTNHPLDLALEADHFFVLQGPNNQQVFSRNGTFRLNQQGQLISEGGYLVQGTAGPLTIPTGAAVVNVARDGSVSADGVAVGQLQTARFTNLNALTAVGPTLYRAGQNAGLQLTTGEVYQGYRESSNVRPAEAMVEMIQGTRYFEAAQRALRSIGEAVQLNTRPQT